jgi:hypothetical protein
LIVSRVLPANAVPLTAASTAAVNANFFIIMLS